MLKLMKIGDKQTTAYSALLESIAALHKQNIAHEQKKTYFLSDDEKDLGRVQILSIFQMWHQQKQSNPQMEQP